MAGAEETLAAATAILHGLAREAPGTASSSPPFDFQFSHPSANGCEAKSTKLPGDPTPAKAAFEKELEALVRRVHHLEFQNVSCQHFPGNSHGPHTVLSLKEGGGPAVV